MEESEVQQYLANILSIVRADGHLTESQELAVEEIRADLKAKKKAMRQSEELVSSQAFEIKAVGRYSDKIRNIEDMLYTAYVDGHLDGSEKEIIVAFAKQLGVTQPQINRLVSEAKSRVLAKRSVAT